MSILPFFIVKIAGNFRWLRKLWLSTENFGSWGSKFPDYMKQSFSPTQQDESCVIRAGWRNSAERLVTVRRQVMVLCLFCRLQDNKNKITLRDHDLLQRKELQSWISPLGHVLSYIPSKSVENEKTVKFSVYSASIDGLEFPLRRLRSFVPFLPPCTLQLKDGQCTGERPGHRGHSTGPEWRLAQLRRSDLCCGERFE